MKSRSVREEISSHILIDVFSIIVFDVGSHEHITISRPKLDRIGKPSARRSTSSPPVLGAKADVG